ncbi:MAG TPA: SRPBCC family protein [Bacteroidia bacterium]
MTVIVMALAGVIIFSPYGNHDGFNYKLILNTVEINAPADSVYKYLGNSDNARKWSVFVDHINTLNRDSFPDGAVGSRRRCFCNADEKGTQWDELVTEVVPGKKRQIIIYHLVDFSMNAEHLATEQIYESIGTNKCKLTFTVFFKDAQPSLWERIKTYIAAYKIKGIFEGNMNNIKKFNERS